MAAAAAAPAPLVAAMVEMAFLLLMKRGDELRLDT
jgi:hypothetical protein